MVTYSYQVQAGDADPLVNTATAHYHPTGFTNDIHASGNWSTDLLHPSFTLAKSCTSQPVSQAGPATFSVTLHNTGDADLVIDPDEGASATYAVAAGASTSFPVSVAGPFAGQGSVSNTVHATATLASKYVLSNVVQTDPASASCTVTGLAKVVKTFSGLPPSGTQSVTFQLRSGASASAAGTIIESQTANAGNGGALNFATQLTPGSTYQMCEVLGPLGPGWMTTLGPPLYSVYNPSGDNSTVCTDFTATAGQTKTFSIDNKPPPGGLGFTIGYWKNWSSCTGGGQKPVLDQTLLKMAQNGTPETLGLLVLNPLTQSASTVCKNAVNILNKSTLTGKLVLAPAATA